MIIKAISGRGIWLWFWSDLSFQFQAVLSNFWNVWAPDICSQLKANLQFEDFKHPTTWKWMKSRSKSPLYDISHKCLFGARSAWFSKRWVSKQSLKFCEHFLSTRVEEMMWEVRQAIQIIINKEIWIGKQ